MNTKHGEDLIVGTGHLLIVRHETDAVDLRWCRWDIMLCLARAAAAFLLLEQPLHGKLSPKALLWAGGVSADGEGVVPVSRCRRSGISRRTTVQIVCDLVPCLVPSEMEQGAEFLLRRGSS